MFLAGDEFGNTQYGNNNSYCHDNEISWLNWELLEKNRDLFEFFQFMIAFRYQHPVIRKVLPGAVCGMDLIHAHDVDADRHILPDGARTFGMSFAGYDREQGRDDIVYIAINTFWENVDIILPAIYCSGSWYLSVNTYGDGEGRYFYPRGQEVRIGRRFVMRPRSVAVFTVRDI